MLLIGKHKEFAFFIFFNFFSITCLTILFWLRVIYERSPRDLSILSLSLILISIDLIVIYLFHLYIYLKLLKNPNDFDNNNKNILKKIIAYFKEKVLFIYTEIQKAFRGLLDLIINEPYFLYGFEYLITSLLNFKYNKYLYYIVFLLPRLIFISVFLVEVIFFNYIDISYKILWLLLIPLFGRIFRVTIYECSTLNIYYLSCLIVMTPVEGPFRETYYEKCLCHLEEKKYYKVKFKSRKIIGEFFNVDALIPLASQHLRSKIFLKHNKEFYDLDTSKFTIIVNIIIIILTIIAWAYVLYLMLSLLNWVYILFIIKNTLMRIIF